MITDLSVSSDAAGFPIVSWTEARGLWAAGGPGLARVECRIMKHPGTGILLFVARSDKRAGGYEEGKPWQALEGCSLQQAAVRHRSPLEAIIRQSVGQKGLLSKILWGDPAQTLYAEFHNDVPIAINDAETTPADFEQVLVTLNRVFVLNRDDLIHRLCEEYHRWPVNDDRVATYDPIRVEATKPAAVNWPVQAAFVATAIAFSGYLVFAVGLALGHIPVGTTPIAFLRSVVGWQSR